MLSLNGLGIGYGQRRLASIADTGVRAGEFICLLGRNGQGKSTLLRTLGGFIPTLAGEVRLNGVAVRQMSGRARAQSIGVVLTDRPQAAALRVCELVEMGRQPHTGWSGALSRQDRRIAAHALEQVDGAHLAMRTVDSLSDGERQRAMIARALAQQPKVMLLDEITAFLDLPSRVTIIDLLRRIAAEQGVAVILSSHDLELSLQTADRLWLLPGQGRFVDGVPEDIVLAGEIGQAFDQPNLVFSVRSGRFERPAHGARAVHVDGDDIASLWLKRALRRRGFALAGRPEEASHALIRSGPGGWTSTGGRAARSIQEALALLA
ncbi:ABC transporter ATP-binding protein [Pseudoxanthomonas wuyuanensis]|uniref:Iron complex transport system ATP-binding protein n=1 Tax=Pseudoxanthomonas wuyuanensis TaxID=1073196 RepID=A0A286CYQ8_9GAMM|nr:ABC transporter ATP-binding protein [Pseudoxanthomonas wuyuanensis]KAF1722780.1 ABC transporter ATP-binding protein [Pseudoxanthomonas wuyuanensis]SOD51540.1 iron complex transport system ATP-binding protein [Pseudoxanthomonas wuyuanensis]